MRGERRYLIYDWILCTLISCGLAVNILSGFDMDEARGARLAGLIAVCAVMCLIFTLASRTRRTQVTGIITGILVIVLLSAVASLRVLKGDASEGGTQVFLTVIIVTALGVFLVCRSRAGIICMFVLGNLIHASAAFLQFPKQDWAYVVFLAAAVAMFFYRVYVISLLKAHTGKVRFGHFMRQDAAMCLLALAVASAIFAGVVKPLDPPTEDLKLIQKLLSFEPLNMIGVASTKYVPDPGLLSKAETRDNQKTNEMDDAAAEEEQAGDDMETDANGPDTLAGDAIETGVDDTQNAMAVSYDPPVYWQAYFIIAAAAVFLLILMRKLQRKRWLAALDGMSHTEGVINMFPLFLYGLQKAGLRRSGNLTLSEFVNLNGSQLVKYEDEKVKFARLAGIYEKAYYGRAPVSDEEYAEFKAYYRVFHKKIRKARGWFRYIFLYFRL